MRNRNKRILCIFFPLMCLLLAARADAQAPDSLATPPPLVSTVPPPPFDPRANMVWVEGRDITWTLPDAAGKPGKADKNSRRTEGFFMDRTEVTNRQFAQFLSASDSNAAFYDPRMDIVLTDQHYLARSGREDFPVAWVDWTAAFAFAKWAGKSLPTEDEWIVAALAGRTANADSIIYPQRDSSGVIAANSLNTGGIPSVVAAASYPQGATTSGIFDLAGNVAEWSLSEESSIVPGGGSHIWIVVKGGSYLDTPRNMNIFSRALRDRSERLSSLGFRCILREPRSH
jgi:formylglycine-generating enzyme required for sulfatase activity